MLPYFYHLSITVFQEFLFLNLCRFSCTLENNSFEIEDDYFNGLFELSCIEEMSLMSNLSVKDKESIKSRLETGKKLVK